MPEETKRKKRTTAEVIADDFRKLEAPGPLDTTGRSERVDLLVDLACRLTKPELDNLVWLIHRELRQGAKP